MKKFFVIHAVLFSSCLILGFILVIFSPKESVSNQEKRKLTEIPSFTWQGVLNGSLMNQLQQYVDDHFPLRSTFVDFAFSMNNLKGIGNTNGARMITPVKGKFTNEKKIDLNKAARDINYLVNAESATSRGVLIIGARGFQVFGGSKGDVKGYIDMVNEYRELLPSNIRIFNCIVPTSSSFVFVKEYDYLREKEFTNIKEAYAMTKPGVVNVLAAEALVSHQNEYIFFASDHHWTGLGAYYAYTAYCDAAGLKATPLSKMQKKTIPNFLGTLYNLTKDQSIKNNVDSVEYFISPVKVQPSNLAEYAKGGNAYGVFLGGDFAHSKFQTSVKNGKSVLVIKNSFGNPFSTFLVNNYETVHVVDYRYFNKGLLKLIDKEGVDDVVFFHNVFSANTLSHSQRQRIIKDEIIDDNNNEFSKVKKPAAVKDKAKTQKKITKEKTNPAKPSSAP